MPVPNYGVVWATATAQISSASGIDAVTSVATMLLQDLL